MKAAKSLCGKKRSASNTPSTVSPRCAVALCNAGDGAAEGLSNNISPLLSSRNISPGVWPQRLALPVNTGPWQTHSINQCFSHTSSLPFLQSRSYARGYYLHKHYHITPLCHFSPAKRSAAPHNGEEEQQWRYEIWRRESILPLFATGADAARALNEILTCLSPRAGSKRSLLLKEWEGTKTIREMLPLGDNKLKFHVSSIAIQYTVSIQCAH